YDDEEIDGSRGPRIEVRGSKGAAFSSRPLFMYRPMTDGRRMSACGPSEARSRRARASGGGRLRQGYGERGRSNAEARAPRAVREDGERAARAAGDADSGERADHGRGVHGGRALPSGARLLRDGGAAFGTRRGLLHERRRRV